MPKANAQSQAQSRSASAAMNALKRNQACHQCRKKKLKCDAQSPCSACVKTHAYAMKTHPATTPATPDCTFDGAEDAAAQARLQEMEAKIRELESKLESQSPLTPPSWSTSVPPVQDFTLLPTPPSNNMGLFTSSPPTSRPLPMINPIGTRPTATIQSVHPHSPPIEFDSANLIQDVNDIFRHFPDVGGQAGAQPRTPSLPTPLESLSGGSSPLLDIMDPNWPPNIPSKELFYHLVDTFFACAPHANRVIQRSNFMASLLQPPTSDKFPHPALLHAICALSSLYTPIIVDTMGRTASHIGPDSLFNSAIVQKRWIYNKLVCTGTTDSTKIEEGVFGLTHAHHFQEEWLKAARIGSSLPQLLQGCLIITWYHHSVGRAVDTWMSLGNCIRTAIPMGLNVGPLWTPISRQPPETLAMNPPVADETERELIRNLFWLCYSQERIYCAGTVWPLIMHDEDVSQYLPLDTTTSGHRFVTDAERQRLNTPKMLVSHPEAITDSFTLYIKASTLLGRVKTFNGRFKNKFSEGVPAGLDPRETAEFQMLDNTISAFKFSIPKEYREPTGTDGKLDPTLYLALVIPHVAMLLLHDPHADPASPNCLSAERMLTAARSILELIYKLTATSFDLMLLDHSCSFCWFVSATALIRFVKARILAGDEAETLRLTSEIQVIRFMMSNLGARTIVGLRQNMILDEMYEAEVQPLIDNLVYSAPPSAADLNAAAGFFDML